MEFNDIKKDFRKLELDTTRVDNDDYFEAVIKRTCLEGTIRLLEGIFGSPAWPSNNKIPKNAEKMIQELGGLRKGQTLYLLNKESPSAFAMLWPWQDGERITIKMGRIS